MKKQIINSGNVSTGERHTFTADLSTNDLLDGKIYIPALGFNKASISITASGPDAITGTLAVKQSVTNGGVGADFAPIISLAVAVDTTAEVYGVDFSGGYLVLIPSIAYPATGRIELNVVLKR